MVLNFYYLAAYTAALGAGFTVADALEIARAARYTGECADFTMPMDTAPEGPGALLDALRIWPEFHYLPGDWEALLKQINPAVLTTGTPELLYGLPLVCLPGGELMRLVVRHVRKLWDRSGRDVWTKAVGIAMHTLADTFLHQGFAGIPAPTVNAVGVILAAGTAPRDQIRKQLAGALAGTPETAFTFEPYLPDEPPAETLGCGQLGGLADRPDAVFTYQSPWAAVPGVVCVNPLRFAAAYFSMREALRYIRNAEPAFNGAGSADQAQLLDLACYFASVQDDAELPATWFQEFCWAHPPTAYRAPTFEADEPYIRAFKLQALAQRDLVMDACPLLRDCAKHFAVPERT